MTLDHVSTPKHSLELGHVRRSAKHLDRLEAEHEPELNRGRARLQAAIVKAHQAGHSYRAIAQAAGISHQRVAQLLQKEEK